MIVALVIAYIFCSFVAALIIGYINRDTFHYAEQSELVIGVGAAIAWPILIVFVIYAFLMFVPSLLKKD